MSEPIYDIRISTPDGDSNPVLAVFDSGSFYTVVREDKVPQSATVEQRKKPALFRAAAKGSRVSVTGSVHLVLTVLDSSGVEKEVDDVALVSPDLTQEMLVGAGTMQKWDISISNRDGVTRLEIGRDMHDADLTAIDSFA